MICVQSGDADIYYQSLGSGAPVVLLHPFPVHHEFWLPVIPPLATKYRLILPDLRGHGQSGIGEGPATMDRHASDIARILDHAEIDRAAFVGVSIGGYVLFECWRRFRTRIAALALCNTKAQADSAEARAARLQAAAEVLDLGTEPFFEGLIPKLIGKTTRELRPDLIEGALKMMRKTSAQDVSAVQRGMADRPDSIAILRTINFPTLIVTGDQDGFAGPEEATLMHGHIPGSQLKIIARAGHYAPWEHPVEVGRILKQFLDVVHGA